jgi:hypothetical protein
MENHSMIIVFYQTREYGKIEIYPLYFDYTAELFHSNYISF